MTRLIRELLVPFFALALGVQGVAVAGAPGVTGTEAMLAESESAKESRQTVQAELARSEVRSQMVAMGVEPAAVEARLAALSETELAELADNIEAAPAGGSVLGVVGAVFVVLLILEAVGVTDVFKAI